MQQYPSLRQPNPNRMIDDKDEKSSLVSVAANSNGSTPYIEVSECIEIKNKKILQNHISFSFISYTQPRFYYLMIIY